MQSKKGEPMSSKEEKIRREKFIAKAKEITATKQSAHSFLMKAGIINKRGQLSPEYR